MSNKISYSRGFPYGAPQVMIRGGGSKLAPVKTFLKARGFSWDSRMHAWTHYMYGEEFAEVLIHLRDEFGCAILPKDGLDPNYILDLNGGN
jgi:hypothetical protein